jgi:ketosteroid isomerase-like protein
MKKILITITVFVVILALPLALNAQETDPAAVVMARAEATNAGDVDAAIAYFADDAVYKIVDPPPGTPDTFTGKDEIRGRLETLVALNASMEVEIQQVDGDKVTVLTKFADDPLKEMGVDFIEGVEEYTVQDGKIMSYQWTMTEASKAKVAAAMPPPTLPESGRAAFPIHAVGLTLGGLAILGGVGLALRRRCSR